MGGGPEVKYPKHVWSPAGGWYNNPVNWKRNTAVGGVVLFGIASMIMVYGSSIERVMHTPTSVPTQQWRKLGRDPKQY